MTALIPTMATGVFLYPAMFESVCAEVNDGIGELFAALGATRLSAPPVISAATVALAGYHQTFPNLLGAVTVLDGTPADSSSPAEALVAGDLTLTVATCHHVFPLLAGQPLSAPASFDVDATCFRNEATAEPGRLRSFRMREIVYAAGPAEVDDWRTGALEAMTGWLSSLGLKVAAVVADDPFYGAGAKVLRSIQREQQVKWEIRASLSDGTDLAIASCNYHRDHFAQAFGFGPAHSACAAFGIERIALALLDSRA